MDPNFFAAVVGFDEPKALLVKKVLLRGVCERVPDPARRELAARAPPQKDGPETATAITATAISKPCIMDAKQGAGNPELDAI